MRSAPLLIRSARLVPVTHPAPDGPVDLRIVDGLVTETGPALDRRPGEDEFDAGGRWAIPGLWDQHVHLTQWAESRGRLDLSGTTCVDDAVAAVRAAVAAGADPSAAVIGFGHRPATWPVAPTAAALDAVSGDHPVVLVSGDAHHGWLNSVALQFFGRPAGSGILAENDWFGLFARLGELPGAPGDAHAAVVDAVRSAHRLGITGIVDLEFSAAGSAWQQRFSDGIDTLRVRAGVYPDALDEVLAAGLRSGAPLAGTMITQGPLKIISDGSLNTRTAYCCEPFVDAGPGAPFPAGRANVPLAELETLLRQAVRGGLTVALHAIGDAAVRDALDAYAATGATGTIEHAQLMRTADIGRMADLGIVASVQPAHLLDDRDVTAQCWPDRADRCFPFASLLSAGVRVALGSDAPVAPLDPWLAMAAAVHRSADAREPWNPAEALTAQQALAASVDGAGTLQAGAPGDVVLLDADPLAAQADSAAVGAALRRMPVAATIVDGRVIHDAR